MAIASKKTTKSKSKSAPRKARKSQRGQAKSLALGMTAVCGASALLGAGIYKLITLA